MRKACAALPLRLSCSVGNLRETLEIAEDEAGGMVEVTTELEGLVIVEGVVGVGDAVRGENLNGLNQTIRLLQWNHTILAPRSLYCPHLTR